MTVVYFVCYGNTCRSPIAADILRQLLRHKHKTGVSVDCFGTTPYYPDNPEVKALRERAIEKVMGGLDGIIRHVPKGVPDVKIRSSDLLVLLVPEYLQSLKDQIPEIKEPPRIVVWNIPDPFTHPFEKYVECAELLKREIERNINLLIGDSS
jgi:protein-tyrosine-phosphatase